MTESATGLAMTGGRVTRIMAAVFVSALGTGLVMPVTAIYIADIRHLGTGAAGLYYGIVALTAITASFAIGRIVDRRGFAGSGLVGSVLLCCSFSGLGLADRLPWILACGAVTGVGQAAIGPALMTALSAVPDEAARRQAFARRYLYLNLGAAFGSAIGGGFVLASHPGSGALMAIYAGDGLSFLPLGLVLRQVARSVKPKPEAVGSLGSVLRTRGVLLALVLQAAIAVFGYSQVEATVPILTRSTVPGNLHVVGALVVINAVSVVVFQKPVARVTAGFSEIRLLLIMSVLWCFAYGVGAAAAWSGSNHVATALLCVFALMFAVGETMYAAAMGPLLLKLAPPSAVGRISALSSTGWSVGNMVGPMLILRLVSSRSPAFGWSLLTIGAAMILAMVLRVAWIVADAGGSPAQEPAAAAA